MKKTVLGAVLASMLALPGVAFADFHIAVASNFDDCLGALIDEYGNPNITKHHDSSGPLKAEIEQFPTRYQLFFSADNIRPQQLADDNRAVQVQQYAEGILVAYSLSLTGGAICDAITNNTFTSLAMGDPTKAPYGVAAQEYLTSLSLLPDNRISEYSNIGLTKDAVDNGNAQIGLIAKGQVYDIARQWCTVDTDSYTDILQDACLILQTPGNAASFDADAKAFLDWIRTETDAQDIIRQYGYLINY